MRSARTMLALAFVAVSMVSMTTAASAQGKKTLTSRGMSIKTALGADTNIKSSDLPKNTVGKEAAAPANKGGKKSSLANKATCYGPVHIDNRTGLTINIYIDTYLRGVVAGYGDLYLGVSCGMTRFYARADLDTGASISWGPQYGDVDPDGTTWTIRR